VLGVLAWRSRIRAYAVLVAEPPTGGPSQGIRLDPAAWGSPTQLGCPYAQQIIRRNSNACRINCAVKLLRVNAEASPAP
jgi:hypothetical protein